MKITEQPSNYNSLDTMSTDELLEGINNEDCRVPEVVGEAIPEIGMLVDGIVERMKQAPAPVAA